MNSAVYPFPAGGVEIPADEITSAVKPSRRDLFEAYFVAFLFFIMELVRSSTKLLTGEEGNTSAQAQIVFGSMYVYAGIRVWALRKQVLILLRGSVPLYVFLGITFCSTAWSVDPLTTFKDAVQLIGTTLIAVYLVARFTLLELLNVLVSSYLAISGFSALLVVGSPARGRSDWGAGPWCGMFVEKNGLGLAMALGVLSFVPLLLQSRGKRRIIIVLLAIVSLVLLVGANSMTSLVICLGVGCLSVIAFGVRARNYGAIIGTAVGGGLLALVIFGFLNTEQSQLFGALGRNSNLTGRTEMWPGLFTAIGDRPILGYGFNVFFEDGGPYADYLASFLDEFNWVPPHAHNSFIQITLDTGLVGLSSFLVVLVLSITRAVKYFFSKADIVSIWPFAIIAFLVLGSYDEVYFEQSNTVSWILFIAATMYPMKERRLEQIAPSPFAS